MGAIANETEDSGFELQMTVALLTSNTNVSPIFSHPASICSVGLKNKLLSIATRRVFFVLTFTSTKYYA